MAEATFSLLDSPRLSARTAVTYHDLLQRFVEGVGADTPIGTVGIEQVEAHLTGRYAHRSPAYYNRSRAATTIVVCGWEFVALASGPVASTRRCCMGAGWTFGTRGILERVLVP